MSKTCEFSTGEGNIDRALSKATELTLSTANKRMLETKRRIEREYAEWINTIDTSDPETQKTIKRLNHFDAKVAIWRNLGNTNQDTRMKAMDNVHN